MGVVRTVAFLCVLIAMAACAASTVPQPTPNPVVTSRLPTAESSPGDATLAPDPSASPSCFVSSPGPDGSYRYATPEEALAAFADAHRRMADGETDAHFAMTSRAISESASRATFTVRGENAATAEARVGGGVATYHFDRSAEGWGQGAFSLPVPAFLCEPG